jgi:hypothetical protein
MTLPRVGQKMVLRGLLVAFVALLAALSISAQASATTSIGWNVRAVAEPSNFSSNDSVSCEGEGKCDSYQLLVTNMGDVASSGTITLTDKLPTGLKPLGAPESGHNSEGTEWTCSESETAKETHTVTCTFPEPAPSGGYAPWLDIRVSAPSSSMSGSLNNEASVKGGGAPATALLHEETPISAAPPSFGVSEFGVQAGIAGGAPALEAGAHPWEITTSFGIPSVFSPASSQVLTVFRPIENMKTVGVELPGGVIGNPQASAKCTQTELEAKTCPAASQIGAFGVIGDQFAFAEFRFTGYPEGCCSAVYNMVPERGYPAEFAFTFAEQSVYLYATVVHGAGGYHVRVTTPGIPSELETSYAAITFFGDPGKLNGSKSEEAFLTNPVKCSTSPLEPAKIELTSWEDPTRTVSKEASVYPSLSGCSSLHFKPSIAFGPSPAPEGGTSQADQPSAYGFALSLPQTSSFSESATPELKDATVTLPEGVSVSPSAAQGLLGCGETGPEGINIGSASVGSGGQDLGDPEATELGAGHAGGNSSPYDDGFYHTAPGKCPEASTLGTVQVTSPLLEKPVYGHLYLAQPKCGGEGQRECTQADAEDGELFGLYLEVGGKNGEGVAWEGEAGRKEEAGVIVKLKGTVAANPTTGQLTARFAENPQLPFSELKIHIHGGPRAPLANPQGCGSFTSTSDLVPWSTPGTPDATPSAEPFAITGCPGSMPFAPSFIAGTISSAAASFSPFTLTLSRNDGEQDFSGIATTLPPGLVGMISQVPLCEEAQANAGSCPEASKIGTTTVTAGAGSQPFPITGKVYLTAPYNGAPFGLSIVVPAKAGPFNLGNVVVRAAITIDPSTSAVTVTSGPIPQMRDGVLFRVKSINVTIDRPGFILNPTNCESQTIAATIAAAQGAKASVSSHFAVSGCPSLSFKPSFTASTQGKTSKAQGASLDTKVSFPASGEVNIRSVRVELPVQLPSRLTTLQKACPAATFQVNPASCPPESIVGIAKASTPVLPVTLEGPAYLVSHAAESFPNLVVILQGDGVRVDLTGLTDIKKGVTSSTFASIPDVPVSSFELYLPEGPHSALAANGNLCALTATKTVRERVPLRSHGHIVRRHGRVVTVLRSVKKTVPGTLSMPTMITGQNGAVINQTTKIKVAGCLSADPKKKARKANKARKAKAHGRR